MEADKPVFGTGTYDNISISSLIRAPLEPCLVVGSGPSLNDFEDYIRSFRGIVIAGASNLKTLTAWGREPDYVVALDSNKLTEGFLTAEDYKWRDTTLLTHPSIYPGVLKNWTGPIKFFRPIQHKNYFFDVIMPIMYPMLDMGLLNAGCTTNCQLELANYLGCWPIYLTGVDYGYVDGLSRCKQYAMAEGRWANLPTPPIQTKNAIRLGSGATATTEEMIAYKQNFFLVLRADYTNVWSCSRGIITPDEVMGYVPPEAVNEHAKQMASDMATNYMKDPEAAKLYEGVLNKMGIRTEEQKDGAIMIKPVDSTSSLHPKTITSMPKMRDFRVSKTGKLSTLPA